MFGDHQVVMHVDAAERPATVKWTTLRSDPLPDWVGTTIDFDVRPNERGGRHEHRRPVGT